jgi:hypothetical protein
MTKDWKADIAKYNKSRLDLIESLQARYNKMRKECEEISNQLKLLGAQTSAKQKTNYRYNNYGVNRQTILLVIEKGGERGVSLQELYDTIKNEYALELTKNTLNSTLARLKKENVVKSIGTSKKFRYVYTGENT